MNELARELNSTLEGSVAYGFLSSVGKRMYFPKGITAQSAEAGEKAKTYNATVGLATSKGQPMHLGDIMGLFREGVFKPSEIFNYAPGGGDKTLRAIWKEEMVRKNPSLAGKPTSGCLVSAGLTHAISMIATLFVDEGDVVVLPDLFWDNYDLIFSELRGARIVTFPFFDGDGFNVEGMKKALMAQESDHIRLMLNFPNNPTGYTPSRREMDAIVKAIVEVADSGRKVMVISDDAYFGLFFEPEAASESLFAYLADAHENIFAIKGDGATKEDMVWGFRIGFVTYASKGLDKAQLAALENKTLGMIRCTVSNCDRPGQSMLVHAYREGENVQADKARTFEEMRRRYRRIHQAIASHPQTLLRAYPFNSGYFMAFDTTGHSAEQLRRHLLDDYGIGTVNIMDRTLRLAYCSVEEESLEDLVDKVYKAAEELWS